MKVLQISDTHIYEDPNKRLGGVHTRDSLTAVMQAATDHCDFDLTILTGDLSMDGSIASYQWLKIKLDSFKRPYYVLPGNHDNLRHMRGVFDLPVDPYPILITLRWWKILLLNTLNEGFVHGSLDDNELERLEKFLMKDEGKKTAIFMHHPAVKVGSDWLDKINLKNGRERFVEIVSRFDVEVVVAGHVHQETELRQKGTSFLTSPSTCAQFKPNSNDFALDTNYPAFRIFEFNEKNSFRSFVTRVK